VHCNKHATATDKWTKNRETAVSMFLAGSKCTGANGASRIIPGSHVWGPTRVPKEEETLYAELDPGDCMYMVSSLFHAGSMNQTTDQERYLYTAFYTKGCLRAEENQYLPFPIGAVKQYTTEQQELVSHRSSPRNNKSL
jgi:ectoine hydroxylase-related dioxygenase (phytanoyl-CoA dioxygenase family)